MYTKPELRKIAKDLSEKLKMNISSIGLPENDLYEFQIKRKRTYKSIALDGTVTESILTDDLFHPQSGEYVYNVVKCLKSEITDGNLEYMIKKGFTR